MNRLAEFFARHADQWTSLIWHAAWQGAVVGIVALAVVALGRRWPAPVRYWILMLALVKFVTPPLVALPTGVFGLVSVSDPRIESVPPGSIRPAAMSSGKPSLAAKDVVTPSTAAESPRQQSVDPAQHEVHSANRKSSSVAEKKQATGGSPAAAGWRLAAILMAAHLAGTALVLALFVFRVLRLQNSWRLMRYPSAELDKEAREIARRLGLRRVPSVRLSPETDVPYSAGILHPIVILPAAHARSFAPDELHAVLCHELAHHRRGDLIINLMQVAIEAVWWFHPVVWLLNRTIRSVREECCDDLLLSQGFVRDESYCATLLHVAKTCRRRRFAAPVSVSIADGLHPLARRIRRIMDETLPRRQRPGALSVTALLALAAIVLPGLRAAPAPKSAASVAAPDAVAGAPAGVRIGRDKSDQMAESDSTTERELPQPLAERVTETGRSRDPRANPAGSTVRGRIVDERNQPVEDATVALGQYFNNFDFPSTAKTDGDGKFHLENCPEGDSLLTVLKVGLAPHMRTVAISRLDNEFNIKLPPGRSLRIRITDKAGQPIAGAQVGPFKWADTVTLTRLHNFGRTDANGIWTWEWAPDEELPYMLFKEGYLRIKDLALRPGAQLHEVQLQPELRVRGKVVDDATGQPIRTFRATLGLVHQDFATKPVDEDRPPPEQWLQTKSVASPEGEYILRHGDFPWRNYLVRIEADGYHSAKSRIYRGDEEIVSIDLRLVATSQREAVVHRTDGTPAIGAAVLVGTQARPASIRDNRPDSPDEGVVLRTDGDGRIRIDAQADDFTVFVLTTSGFARAKRAEFDRAANEPLKIVLKPWARVDGIVRKRPTRLATQMVQVDLAEERGNSPGSGMHVRYHLQTKSDAEGHFVFARVPPDIDVVATHYGPVRTQFGPFLGSHNSAQFKVAAGQARTIALGGSGRTIIGNFRLKDSAWAADWEASIGVLELSAEPAIVDILYRPAPLFDIEPDGSFRIEEVPPGPYRIAFSLLALKAESSLRQGPRAVPQNQKGMHGLMAGEITVTEADNEADDLPVDIGTLQVGYANAKMK